MNCESYNAKLLEEKLVFVLREAPSTIYIYVMPAWSCMLEWEDQIYTGGGESKGKHLQVFGRPGVVPEAAYVLY